MHLKSVFLDCCDITVSLGCSSILDSANLTFRFVCYIGVLCLVNLKAFSVTNDKHTEYLIEFLN